MKCLFLSDLHLDENERTSEQRLTSDLILFIEGKECDVVVISGDIAGSSRQTIYYLDMLREFLTIPVYFIPGNHDIWTNHDSWEEYKVLLEHPSCIENQIIPLTDDYSLVGWMGWYDYSFKPQHLFYSQILSGKKQYWKDYKYALWGKSDEELFYEFIQNLKDLLEQTKDKKVILSTHFIPFQSLITYRQYDKEWNLTNSFMGSANTGHLVQNYPNISHVFYGHTHEVKITEITPTLTTICTPLGYQHEWSDNPFFPISFKEALEKKHYILEI